MAKPDFIEALRTQGRVLLALMLREARTRYGRRQAGYLWALVEPLMHIGVFYILYTYTMRGVPIGHSLAMFLATGLATFLGFRNVMGRTQGGYGSNEALLSVPIVKIVDVFLGRGLLELVTWVIVTILLIGGLIALGQGGLPRSALTMLTAILLLFLLGLGVGTTLGLLGEFIPSLSGILSIPNRILYFTSGVFYLPDTMPPSVRDFLGWNPVLHGVGLFREGYYAVYKSHMLDVQYLMEWALGSILVALIAERLCRKAIRSMI